MPPIQSTNDEYTDVVLHHDGTTSLEFEHILDPPVEHVTAMQLIAYDLPSRKQTVDSSNDSIDFAVGPFIAQATIVDAGHGYDMFNPPNLHLTHYRSSAEDAETPGPEGSAAWYPPFRGRSISGLQVAHATHGRMSAPIPSNTWDTIFARKVVSGEEDTFQMALAVNDSRLTAVQVYSKARMFEANESTCMVGAPFEYPYSLHITRLSPNAQVEEAHIFTDVIKIYRAFYRYEKSGSNDIAVLARQIAMEINYALGWDVRNQLNDGIWADDNSYRWSPENRGAHLHAVGRWPANPHSSPRYICVWTRHKTNTDGFFFVDIQNSPFNFGHVVNGGQPQPLQWTDKVQHDDQMAVLSDGYREHFAGSGDSGARQACLTTLWGILGFISPITSKKKVPLFPWTMEGFSLPDGTTRTVQGFMSLVDASSNLERYYDMYRERRAATVTLDVMRCTARLRHGVYSIGNVLHQNYKRSGNTQNVPSRHIHVRQAADGLIKEVQDQMNIAYNGHTIRQTLGNTDDIVGSYTGAAWRLHVPHFSGSTSRGIASPHIIVVSLENADIEDPLANQSSTNLRTNQHRKTNVRISISELHETERPSGSPSAKTNLTLQLLFRSGPNSSRSAASMLGFERADIPDRRFIHYVPQTIGQDTATSAPGYAGFSMRYMYGVQAASVHDTSIRSKACMIDIGINAKVNYESVAVAMISGRTDHAVQTCNTDGSVQSFLNETIRLSGFNRDTEIGADAQKTSVFTEADVLQVVRGMLTFQGQISQNTPVLRASDWGTMRVTLPQRVISAKRLCVRGRDARTGGTWECNSAETSLFMVRLYHPREDKNTYRRQS